MQKSRREFRRGQCQVGCPAVAVQPASRLLQSGMIATAARCSMVIELQVDAVEAGIVKIEVL